MGAALCLPAPWAARVLTGRLRSSYLFVGVTYVLPFQFVFLYLMNHGSEIWGQSLLIALIVLFHFQFAWALLSFTVGVLCLGALFAFVGDSALLTSRVLLAHLPVYAFMIIVISAAKVGRRVLANEKLAGMAQGLATVSHELRTPLISVDANVRGIHRRLASCANPERGRLARNGRSDAAHPARGAPHESHGGPVPAVGHGGARAARSRRTGVDEGGGGVGDQTLSVHGPVPA
ncbi:hypothetical protein LP420_28705 [Massilia sp. B-10]|nr:hypothetical protein LP420_28705 [Massilia sp. B-10]